METIYMDEQPQNIDDEADTLINSLKYLVSQILEGEIKYREQAKIKDELFKLQGVWSDGGFKATEITECMFLPDESGVWSIVDMETKEPWLDEQIGKSIAAEQLIRINTILQLKHGLGVSLIEAKMPPEGAFLTKEDDLFQVRIESVSHNTETVHIRIVTERGDRLVMQYPLHPTKNKDFEVFAILEHSVLVELWNRKTGPAPEKSLVEEKVT